MLDVQGEHGKAALNWYVQSRQLGPCGGRTSVSALSVP